MTGVVFTRTTRTNDDAGAGSTVTVTEIPANAMKVSPNRVEEDVFRAQGLVRERTVVLGCTTQAYGGGVEILPGDTVAWKQAGVAYTWTVRAVPMRVEPDGQGAVYNRVVVSR